MNGGTSEGRMPANVFVNARATVTAGLANDVDGVNQYAAVIYAPTANGTAAGRLRTVPQITLTRPNVATNSLSSCCGPDRTCVDHAITGSPNMTFASITPQTALVSCTARYESAAAHGIARWLASASVTAGVGRGPPPRRERGGE